MEENICYLAFMSVDYEGINEDTIKVFDNENSALDYINKLKSERSMCLICDDRHFEINKYKINK